MCLLGRLGLGGRPLEWPRSSFSPLLLAAVLPIDSNKPLLPLKGDSHPDNLRPPPADDLSFCVRSNSFRISAGISGQ